MRRAFLTFAALALLVAANERATAAPTWTGPGWYQLYADPGGYTILAGPFSNEHECRAASLPKDAICSYEDHDPSNDG